MQRGSLDYHMDDQLDQVLLLTSYKVTTLCTFIHDCLTSHRRTQYQSRTFSRRWMRVSLLPLPSLFNFLFFFSSLLLFILHSSLLSSSKNPRPSSLRPKIPHQRVNDTSVLYEYKLHLQNSTLCPSQVHIALCRETRACRLPLACTFNSLALPSQSKTPAGPTMQDIQPARPLQILLVYCPSSATNYFLSPTSNLVLPRPLPLIFLLPFPPPTCVVTQHTLPLLKFSPQPSSLLLT